MVDRMASIITRVIGSRDCSPEIMYCSNIIKNNYIKHKNNSKPTSKGLKILDNEEGQILNYDTD